MLAFFSSVLLVIGSIVGGGIVAIPIITAGLGFANTVKIIALCWVLMTLTGAMILTLSLRCPIKENTYYSIVGRYLGPDMQMICTICFVMLLYFNLSSYTSGMASLALSLVFPSDNLLMYALMSTVFIVFAGGFLFSKRHWILHGNVVLVSLKILLLVFVIAVCLPHASTNLPDSDEVVNSSYLAVFMVILNAFGFHFIVPSMVTSYGRKPLSHYFTILITGTTLVAGLYLCWLWSIQAVIPVEGELGLKAIQNSNNQLLALNQSIGYYAQTALIGGVLRVFQTVSMLGSFLCVALGLLDFMRDSMKTNAWHRIAFMTFFPPLIMSLMSQNMYLKAMIVSGYLAIFLEIVIPTSAYFCSLFPKQVNAEKRG